MPVITIRLAKGRPIETTRAGASLHQNCGGHSRARPEWVTVLIEEYERENWATGGELHADKFGPGSGKAGTGE